VELLENVVNVVLDCRQADAKTDSDLLVRETEIDERHNFDLT
jgi:hypothetical protein